MLFHAIMNENTGAFEAQDSEEENAPAIAVEANTDGFSVENTADIVLEMNAIDSVKSGTFNKLGCVALHIVGEAGIVNVPAHELLAVHLDLAEESAILQTVQDPERYAKGDKQGKIKTARYLSKTYQHARSTLINFLENGGSLTDEDGNVKGKTAIEKEKKEAKAEKTPEEKLEALAQTVRALLVQCAMPNAAWDDFKDGVLG